MVKKTCFVLFGLLFLIVAINLASADETRITVKALTQYNYSITLNVLDPATMDALTGGSFENSTESNGQVTFVFSSATRTIALGIIARQNGKIVFNKKYGNYSTGSTITIDLFESTYTPGTPTQTTTTATNNTTNIRCSYLVKKICIPVCSRLSDGRQSKRTYIVYVFLGKIICR